MPIPTNNRPTMTVEIDAASGFCFGVERAISRAEEALREHAELFSLGDIVHNRIEVQRLEQLGMRTIAHEQMPRLTPGASLLIRAHGEPPATYRRAEELGLRIIDATCPVVAKLQDRVVRAHEQMARAGGQVVLLGKRNHAEVIGLTNQVASPTIVIEREEELEKIDFSRPVFFLSQTTQSITLFRKLTERMRERAAAPELITAHDTICRQVANRETHLEAFARRFDAIVFVCGRKSSNGKVLFEVCRGANPRSYNVEEAAELQAEWFDEAASVGICGATSTPKWLMQEVAEAVGRLDRTTQAG